LQKTPATKTKTSLPSHEIRRKSEKNRGANLCGTSSISWSPIRSRNALRMAAHIGKQTGRVHEKTETETQKGQRQRIAPAFEWIPVHSTHAELHGRLPCKHSLHVASHRILDPKYSFYFCGPRISRRRKRSPELGKIAAIY
jgi:hypothetical protein